MLLAAGAAVYSHSYFFCDLVSWPCFHAPVYLLAVCLLWGVFLAYVGTGGLHLGGVALMVFTLVMIVLLLFVCVPGHLLHVWALVVSVLWCNIFGPCSCCMHIIRDCCLGIVVVPC